MNILFVISSAASGGAEVYVKDLAKALVIRGHSVHIGFLNRAKDYGRSEVFELKFLKELSEFGIEYFFIGKHSRILPIIGLLKVRSYVKENEIDVYHAHLTHAIGYGAFLRIPRIYTHHSIVIRGSKSLFALLSNVIESLVGISDLCSKALSEHSERPVHTISNGVDGKKFKRKNSVARTLGKSVNCLAVGRVTEAKNYKLLIEAILQLPELDRARLNVCIAGEGPKTDTEALKNLIASNNLGGSVKLLGNVTNIPKLMGESDLFLMSSAWEGLPISLIEACYAGLPCVVTDVGGCSEVINLVENGYVVPAGDAIEFAAKISEIINSETLYSTLSTNAFLGCSNFSIEKAAERHEALYQSLLN